MNPSATIPPAILDWLLDDDNPSVRYLVLRDLVNADRPALLQARQRIMESGPVPAILDAQLEGGNWEAPERMYTAKYRGTLWQLIVLAELHADADDERVKRACNFALEHSWEPTEGGFSMASSKRAGGGLPGKVIPCLTGNMVWALARLGFADDERVRAGVSWLARYLRFDDGDSEPPDEQPFRRGEICWGRHTCFMTVVKGLKALAEVPEKERNTDVQLCIEQGVEFLMKHHVFKKSRDLSRMAKPGWKRFGFPLMYQTDVLEILRILTRLGCDDRRMGDAMDLVRSKRDAGGRWILANSFNGKMHVDIERKGQPSRWLTLHALRVLR